MGGAAIHMPDLMAQGVAAIVATRDAELRPQISRAWGPALSEDETRLTVCVEASPGSAMARNLERGSPVAVQLARIAVQTTVQLNGGVTDVAAPTPAQLEAAAQHVDRFVAELAQVGAPERIARAMVGSDLVAVTVEIAEWFDDTPGRGNGRSR